MASSVSGDPVLDWLRQMRPVVERRASEVAATPGTGSWDAAPPGGSGGEAVAVEIIHRRHRDHPTWDIPSVPGDLFPLRAAAMVGHGLQHHPVCAVVVALRSGETARVRSDHAVGPLCHALDDRCAAEVEWRLEGEGPEEWTLLLTRR